MAHGNYSFKSENISFGAIILDGFADGDDVVSITQNNDAFTMHVGAKGDTTRTQSSDDSVTVTIKLLQTSESAKELIATHIADKETGGGVFPLVAVNSSTGEVHTINNAFIAKMPDVMRGKGQNAYEFTFVGSRHIPVLS